MKAGNRTRKSGALKLNAGRDLTYRIMLRGEPEGGYTVTVPSLPGCVTYGDDVPDAIRMAREAIELYIESLKEHGEEIPTEERTLEYSLSLPLHA
jgi:predicted RNase H-like HicB family nuclease